MSANDQKEVVELYKSWCAAFQSLDVSGMKKLFDQEFQGLIYQSEETESPMYTWGEIDAYWDNIPGIVSSIPEWRVLDEKVAVDDDTATVYLKLATHIELVGAKEPLVGVLRATLGARKRDGVWRLVSLHESRHVDLAHLF
ncbi:nuclear transport factor 2 family protein [Amycolatopsis methanolica]|uniref:nuclear transport factor 2 family protein n=1 Tax=Amycolatopsis methanolica TaxID=1814 RepID=UPI00343146BC